MKTLVQQQKFQYDNDVFLAKMQHVSSHNMGKIVCSHYTKKKEIPNKIQPLFYVSVQYDLNTIAVCDNVNFFYLILQSQDGVTGCRRRPANV